MGIRVNFSPTPTPLTKENKVCTNVDYHIYVVEIQCDYPKAQDMIEKSFLEYLCFSVNS